MSLLSLLAFCLLCWLSSAATVRAGNPSPPPRAIWSGLVLATNDPRPAQPPTPLRLFAGKLKNIFGYNQFDLVGESAEKVDGASERWLIPSKDFCLSVKTHNEPDENYAMKIVLFQNRRRLAEFETHLNSGSPLFIRGPLYAGGQLVIVLRVMDPSEIPVHLTRAPSIGTKPGPTANSVPLKKANSTPASIGTATLPKDKSVSPPAERIVPVAEDHSAPISSPRPGDIDAKSAKP